MASICVVDDLCKSWEKSGKVEFLHMCKTFVGSHVNIIENVESKDLKRLLYELCWAGVNGQLNVDQITAALADVADMHPEVPSLVSDIFCTIDVELMCNEETETRERFISLVTASQSIVSENLLKERLDADALESVGLVNLKTAFQQKYVKMKTKLYYKQQKFNLLREESEGYAKLITELNQDVSHEVVLQNIKSLIGCFNLDPNRVLDVILESFECRIDQTALFLPLLEAYANDRETLCHILGFRFHFYQTTEDSVTPDSLYNVAALLLHHGLIDLTVLYAHLTPPNSVIIDEYKQEMAAAKQYLRQSMVVSLTDKPSAADVKSSEDKDKFETRTNNQKFGLCEALVKIGSWELAKKIMTSIPPFSAVSHKPIAQCLCKLIHFVIAPLYYRFSGLPKVVLNKQQPVSSIPHVKQAKTYTDLLEVAFPVLCQLGPHLACDQVLLVRINRLAKSFMEKKSELSLTEQEQQEVFAGFLTVYDEVILPSLSLMPHNCCLSEEVWGFIRLLKYEHRYRLYGQWKHDSRVSHPRLIRAYTDILEKAKYIMKRLAKENVKPLGRQLGKLSHTAPGVVFEYVLSQIQKYDNFIGPVVDSLKFLTDMSYDVLLYCVIEAFANPERERLKTDDTNISFWLQCLANFSGSVLKKYQVDIAGLLQYIANQLKAQKSYDLAILREVIQKMAGIEVSEEMTNDQLLASCGGELLRQEGGYFTQIRNTKKSSGRLMESLQEHDLTIPLCLLMSQQRQGIVFQQPVDHQFEDKRHLKLIGKLYDQCQATLVQFISFLSVQLSADELVKRLPNIHDLLTTYHIPTEVAFALWRIVYASSISSKLDELRRPEKKEKTSSSTSINLQRYLEAVESVMQPVRLLVEPVHPPKVWEELSRQFYCTFWSLTMYDLHVPTTAYDKQIQQHKSQISLDDDKDMTQSKKKKEKERCQMVVEKLLDEEKRQHEHVRVVMARLKSEKDAWFPSKAAKHSAITTILQLCVFPRCCFTYVDAVYCAKLLFIMHNLRTPNFSSLICYDRIFSDITWALTSCTEGEAHRYGRFLCSVLDDVMRWHADRNDFDKECSNYPGFVTVFRAPGTNSNFADNLDYENYRHVVHKWHYSITRVAVNCLESADYCQIRNVLIVLTKIQPHYPRVTKLGQALERRVERVVEEEKEKRPDLHVLALAYLGQLKNSKKTWVNDTDFHRSAKGHTKPGSGSSASASSGMPAASSTVTPVTVKREPTTPKDKSTPPDVKPVVTSVPGSSSSSSAARLHGSESGAVHGEAKTVTITPRSDTKESKESSSKPKSKHKQSDASSDGSERPHKESRHESYGRERGQTDAEKAPKRDDSRESTVERVQHRDEKRSDGRSPADVDARLKDRSHRTDVDTDGRIDGDRSHRATERDQVSADDVASGNIHRRSADTSDDRDVKRRKVDLPSGSKEIIGLVEPSDKHHRTSAHVSERPREHSERIVTIGRPVRDAELETKVISRSEKSERPRASELLMQNIPLDREPTEGSKKDVKRHRSLEYNPPATEDEPSQLNGSESQERRPDSHRSRSKDGDKAAARDAEKAARNSRGDDAARARSLTRERVRPNDGDVSESRVWSPQQEEAVHEKARVKDEGTTRGRRSKHRLNEPLLKESEVKEKATSEKRAKKVKRR